MATSWSTGLWEALVDSEITRSDRVDAIDSDWGAYMRAAMTTVARVILRVQRVLSRTGWTGWWARVVSAGGGCGLGFALTPHVG